MNGQISGEWWCVFILINLFFGDGIRDDKKSYVLITCLTIIDVVLIFLRFVQGRNMKVASDVLGDLKTAYVNKTIVKKLDEHKPLEDLDALSLIGGMFTAGYQAKRKHLALANPFNDYYAKDKKESRRDAYSKLTSKKLADVLNEEYARSQLLSKSAWQNEDFQKLMLEVAARWVADNKRKRVKLEF